MRRRLAVGERERAANSIVNVKVGNHTVSFVPQHGELIGTSEAPRVFVQAFKKPVELWQQTEGITDTRLVWKSGICEIETDVSLSSFADDFFKESNRHGRCRRGIGSAG